MSAEAEAITLYRPVGEKELALIRESVATRFPYRRMVLGVLHYVRLKACWQYLASKDRTDG